MPRRARTLALFLALGALAGPGRKARAEPDAEPLAAGRPVRVRLERGAARWERPLDVPAGIDALHVFLQSRQDVDLYLERGPRPLRDLADADESDDSSDGEEHVQVAHPAAGRWWLTVDHPAAVRGGTTFTVAVLWTGGREPAYLPLDRPTPWRADAEGALRAWTFLPLDAPALRVLGPGGTLDVHDAAGVRRMTRANAPRGDVAVRAPGPHLVEMRPPDGRPFAEHAFEVEAPVAKATRAVPLLVPGEEVEMRLGGKGAPATREFRLLVPPSTPGLEISVVSDPGSDLDLYARHGATAEADDDVDDVYTLTTGEEDLLVLGGTAGVRPGSWSVKVHTTDDDEAVDATLLLRLARRPAVPGTRGGVPPPLLVPDVWTPGEISAQRQGTAWYQVEIPPGASTLHAQVLGATSDVELFLVDGPWGIVRERAVTVRLDERLVVPLGRSRGWEGSRAVLGVINPQSDEEEIAFRLAVGFGRPPPLPADLALPPFAPARDLRPLERAAGAVVDIATEEGGGSGVCLTPGGLIVTCRHVLEVDDAGEKLVDGDILIGFVEDPARPPRQTHVARLIDSDADLDLALLEITGDVFGRPVPTDTEFPCLPPALGAPVHLGDGLWVLGFPSSGSERSRTPVIAVRGVVCGTEETPRGPGWIKTDAHISNGHSGGAALDEGLRLVGIACATLGDYDQLGLIRPVTRFPKAWTDRMARGARTSKR